MNYAQRYVRKIWNVADQLGYGGTFVDDVSGQTIDDHLFVNEFTGIPSVAIVHYHTGPMMMGYGSFHHTHADNMDIIDKGVLQQVGEVVMHTIYKEQ